MIDFKKFRSKPGKLIHKARIFELKKMHITAPDGRQYHHDVMFHPGASVIIPVLPGERFVLIRQYRPAIRRDILEFPAGTLEHREAPLACAKREVTEETGYRARKWKKLTTFYPAPGVSTELMYFFLATDLVEDETNFDRDEFLRNEIMTYHDLQKLILQGKILDGKTLVGFYAYSEHRKRGKKP